MLRIIMCFCDISKLIPGQPLLGVMTLSFKNVNSKNLPKILSSRLYLLGNLNLCYHSSLRNSYN